MRTFAFLAAIFILCAGELLSQPTNERMSVPAGVSKVGGGCSGGIQYDDGAFESAYKFNSFAVSTGSYAMAFDIPANSALKAVCVCWVRDLLSDESAIAYSVKVWAADGPGGAPGTLIDQAIGNAQGVGFAPSFFRTDLDIPLTGTRVWIGPEWHPGTAPLTYLCADESATTTLRPAFRSESGSPPNQDLRTVFPNYHALGVRAEIGAGPLPPPPDPDPPAGPWLSTTGLPGYQFKVRINGSALGTQVTDCVPETLCVAGAIPTRTELFLRIIGPRPNGFLWDQLVRFTTSRLEVWVQRLSTSEINYYNLPAIPTDSSELPGLVDREAFTP